MPPTQGYAVIIDPEKGIKETDTYTCAHCNRVIHLPDSRKIEEVGDFCRSCMKVICLTCADHPCVPFLKKLEQWEQKAYIRSTYV